MSNIDEEQLARASKFGGYDKRQVLLYIKSIRESHEYTTQQLEKKQAELETTTREYILQLEAFEKTVITFENRLYEEQNRVGNLNITINELNLEIASQRVSINEKERHINELSNENRFATEQAGQLALKAKKYDDIKENIGAILLEAKANSGAIIDRAQLKGKEIVKEAEAKLNVINNDITSLRHQLSMGRKFLMDLTKTICDKLDNVDIVVNSIDHSINYDTASEKTASKIQSILVNFDDNEEDSINDDDNQRDN